MMSEEIICLPESELVKSGPVCCGWQVTENRGAVEWLGILNSQLQPEPRGIHTTKTANMHPTLAAYGAQDLGRYGCNKIRVRD